jgi:SAM-dependent methyltransferase
MGLNSEAFSILAGLAQRGALAGKDCITLGRQNNFVRRSDFRRVAKRVGLSLSESQIKELTAARFIEPILLRLGARSVASIDASDYEDATIVCDMNKALPDELAGRYDFVFDGGTLEHVYNFPQALKNMADLLRPGGLVLSASPSNNEPGHGFYQFSPELIYSAFPAVGLSVVHACLASTQFPSQFYELSSPSDVGGRITFLSGEPIQLLVIACKSPGKAAAGQVLQSDYAGKKWASGSDHLTWDRSFRAKLGRLAYRVVVLRCLWPLNFFLRSLALPGAAVWPTSPGIKRVSIWESMARFRL